MGMFKKLRLSGTTTPQVEWQITPDQAFCTFSAKGVRGELAKTGERICYFFIDNWGSEPKLYLMERGVRYVNILAEVKAPPAMLANCLGNQPGAVAVPGNFPIDSALQDWLLTEVVEADDSPYLLPISAAAEAEDDQGAALPPMGQSGYQGEPISLPTTTEILTDDQLEPLIREGNFYDACRNPHGSFVNFLADPDDGLTVVDERTGLMWQRGGLDLGSAATTRKRLEKLRQEGFAGHHDWRLPTLTEAMSLLEAAINAKGLHLHPCFSAAQPFIFVAARRKPTGYWFVDFVQGRAYWSSGTVPGGFARLCRAVR